MSIARSIASSIARPIASSVVAGGVSPVNKTWPAETIAFGTPSDPVTGTNISSGTWLIGGRPVPRTGTLTTVKIYSGASATVKVKVFSRTGLTFTWVREESFAVVSGLNTITTNLAVTAGDFLAVYSATSGFMKYNVIAGGQLSGTEYYDTAGDNTTTFTVGAATVPTQGVRLELQFSVDVAETEPVNAVGDLIYIGPSSPSAGDTPNVATSSSTFEDHEFIYDGRVESITAHATAAGVLLIPILQKTASTYTTQRSFALQLASGLNTYVAGTHFPIDVVIPSGGLFGKWVLNTSLSAKQNNGRSYRKMDATLPGGVYPGSPVLFASGSDITSHAMRIGVRPTESVTPPTDRVDQTFNSAIPPWFNSTNWSIVSGKARNSSAGLANRIEFRNGGYYDGTASLWVTFGGATDEIALWRRGNSGEILGSLCSINASTGLIAIHEYFDGSNTLPAVAVSKTCGFSLTTGVEYKVDFVKSGTTLLATISNPLSSDTDTLTYSAKNGSGGHATENGFAVGNPGFAATVGTVDVSRFRFTAAKSNPKVMIFGDSITEGSGATADSNGWAQQVVAAMPTGRGLISAHAGNGSSNILTRIEKEVRQFMPQHVVVEIGTNDTDVSVWQANIAEIVDRVESCGATCWIGTVLAENGHLYHEEEMNPWLRLTYPDNLINFDYALTIGGTGLSADRISSLYRDTLHPNDDGHSAMFDQVQTDAPSIFN